MKSLLESALRVGYRRLVYENIINRLATKAFQTGEKTADAINNFRSHMQVGGPSITKDYIYNPLKKILTKGG